MNTSDCTRAWPAFSEPDDYRRMRDVFEIAGYRDKTILEALQIGDFPSLRGQDLPILMKRTDQGTPLHTLMRLFLMEMPVPVSNLESAIRPMTIGSWMEAGLLARHGDSLQATVKIVPFHDMLVAFDPDRTTTTEDYVMGIGSSSLTLANITVRRQGAITLDLGTGCGIQALLAANHSTTVTATDSNPRAVAAAQFNGRLNGLDHVACVEGDLFAPAGSKKFDLIISNPPFVISPDTRFIYRDSGMEDDQLCRTIIREAPRFLDEGGFCQMLCNWAEYGGEDWRDRLGAWFRKMGCDVWVIRSECRRAETYASTWIRHTEKLDNDSFGRRFDEWMDYYQKRGIESIAAGIIMMRRRSKGPNWVRLDDGPEKIDNPCSDAVLRGFEAMDFLETVRDDENMLGACFSVSPHVRFHQQYRPEGGTWSVVESSVQLSTGFGYYGHTDPVVASLLAACNGGSTLREIIAGIISQLEGDSGEITHRFVELARRFVERGFIMPGQWETNR